MSKEIKPIKIGAKRLENNLFLAPMLGFTNAAFREIIQKTAKISVFSEMIPANALSKDGNYCKDLIKRGKEEKNLFYQFFGNNEEMFCKSIENLQNLGTMIDFININLGCPALNITSQGAGCALLKKEPKIYKIVSELNKHFDIPITIKTRSGYEKPKHLNYKKLEDEGCDAIFIHAKTKKQYYGGKTDLNFLKEAKEKTNIPIIANGDITNMEDILYIHNQTNADGFMIGRRALKDPFIFREIITGRKSTYVEKLKFVDEYYEALQKYDFSDFFMCIKVFVMGITKGVENGAKKRIAITKAKSYEEIMQILKN